MVCNYSVYRRSVPLRADLSLLREITEHQSLNFEANRRDNACVAFNVYSVNYVRENSRSVVKLDRITRRNRCQISGALFFFFFERKSVHIRMKIETRVLRFLLVKRDSVQEYSICFVISQLH